MPAADQLVVLGSSIGSDFACADVHSGIDTCTGPATLDTATLGTKSLQVTGVDRAGRTTVEQTTYVVVVEAASGNGFATTDGEGDGATATDPIETSVTAPGGGAISIGETTPSGSPPTGFRSSARRC